MIQNYKLFTTNQTAQEDRDILLNILMLYIHENTDINEQNTLTFRATRATEIDLTNYELIFDGSKLEDNIVTLKLQKLPSTSE